MGFIKEFKEFAMRGNVVDLAIGVIIGGAFGKIVTSMVNDIIMPPIGIILGGLNFKDLKLVLKKGSEAVKEGDKVVKEAVAEVSLNYGNFIQNIVDFLIIAFVIFLAIKAVNRLKKREEVKPAIPPAPPEPTTQEKLLMEIRDLLKNK
ncbi:MAG: large-conductance mechanosensitive channel protein MscL [Microscillaceae bacterium]|nr:large-conductance mechanosensitive channel protein MscL [Microscillaceae bacterium]MDW8459602.1 large-conductance mechanosensitive channel protein MscL [Cytophagales bacterium]